MRGLRGVAARQRPRLPLTREVDSPKAKTEGEKTKSFLRFVLSPSQLTLTAPSSEGGKGADAPKLPPLPHTFSYKEERL